MTRAEKAGLEAFPENIQYSTVYDCQYDVAQIERRKFIMGYEQAEKDLGWHSVDESLPPIDEEVIVLADILVKDGTKVGFGRICYAHRPNPEGWDGKDIFTGKITHHDVVTYDGWNIPGVKYWMHCPKIPEE